MAAKHPDNKKKKLKRNPAAHLQPHRWPKGKSGNPNGRIPKEFSVTSVLKVVHAWPAPKTIVDNYRLLYPNLPDNPTNIEMLVVRGYVKALDIKTGDMMAREIWDRTDGRVPFPLIGGGPGSDPVGVKFDFSDMPTEEVELFRRLLGKCQKPEE